MVQRLSHGLCPDESPGHSHDDNEADFDFVPVIPELFSETKWPEQAVQLEKKASRTSTPIVQQKKPSFKSQTPAIPRSISFSENISPSEPKLTDNRLRGKHSRLRRELSLAIQTSTQQCNVVHSAESDIHELSDSDSDSDDISSCPVSLRMHFGKQDRFLDSSWGDNAPDTQTRTSLINIAMGAEVSVVDPKNIHEALESENRDRWVEAIAEEMRQHEINGTFGPPQVLPLGLKATKIRFLFKTKMGQTSTGKLRLVLIATKLGCSIKTILGQGTSHLGKKPLLQWLTKTLRLFFHMAATKRMFLRHIDLQIYCALYMDDILSAGMQEKKLLAFLLRMGKIFRFMHLGVPKVFLGIEINYFREVGVCTLTQKSYVEKLIQKFLNPNEQQYFPTTPIEANLQEKLATAETEPIFSGPYRELVGGLLYATVCTRPDLAFATCILTQQFATPRPTHFHMALRVLKYLAGTSSYGITLGCANTNNQELVAFSDSDFAACLKTRKSVRGFILFLVIHRSFGAQENIQAYTHYLRQKLS